MYRKLKDMRTVYRCYHSMLSKLQEEETRQRAEYQRMQGITPPDKQMLEETREEIENLVADRKAIDTNLEKIAATLIRLKRSDSDNCTN